MSRNPIYGFCSAGCRHETVSRADWEESISAVKLEQEGGGVVISDTLLTIQHRIYSNRKEQSYYCDVSNSTAAERSNWGSGVGLFYSGCALVTDNNNEEWACFFGSLTDENGVRYSGFYRRNMKTYEYERLSDIFVNGAAVFAINNTVYMLGGNDYDEETTVNTGKCYKYNPNDTAGVVQMSAVFQIECAAAGVLDGVAYLFGGERWQPDSEGNAVRIFSSNVYKFDPNTEVVTAYSANTFELPYATTRVQCAVGKGGIYIYGGKIDASTYGAIWRFDGQTLEVLSETFAYSQTSMGVAAIGNKHYLFGYSDGVDESGVIGNSVRCFDTETGTFETVTSYLEERKHGCVCLAYGAKIYVLGGSTGDCLSSQTVGNYPCEIFNVPTYDCDIHFISPGAVTVHFPITCYDKYRSYFTFELLDYGFKDATNTAYFVYELNGERKEESVYIPSWEAEDCRIEIRGANTVYQLNLTGGLFAAPNSPHDYLLFTDSATAKKYKVYIENGELKIEEREV